MSIYFEVGIDNLSFSPGGVVFAGSCCRDAIVIKARGCRPGHVLNCWCYSRQTPSILEVLDPLNVYLGLTEWRPDAGHSMGIASTFAVLVVVKTATS
jgi:hypothetical protein